MKKIHASWRGNWIDSFWSPEHGVMLYHPAEQLELLHEEYGGKNYYVSRSGLSGRGYISPKPGQIIVSLGFYRTDANEQVGNVVEKTDTGREILCYVPIRNGGSDWRYPIVLSDGNRVCFVEPWQEKQLNLYIYGWEDHPWDKAAKKIEVKWEYGGEKKKTFLLLTNGCTGPDVFRFFDLSEAEEHKEILLENYGLEVAPWHEFLGIHPIKWDKFAIVSKFVSKIFEKDNWPAEINGWVISKKGKNLFCWKVNNRKFAVHAMCVNIENNEFADMLFSVWDFNPDEAERELKKVKA